MSTITAPLSRDEFFETVIKTYGKKEVLNEEKIQSDPTYWYSFMQCGRRYKGTEINLTRDACFVFAQTQDGVPECYTVFTDRPSPIDD